MDINELIKIAGEIDNILGWVLAFQIAQLVFIVRIERRVYANEISLQHHVSERVKGAEN